MGGTTVLEPSVAITVVLLMMTFWLAWARGYSPLEMVSEKADAAFVGALRRRVSRSSQ